MPESTTQFTNVPASEPGTATNNTHNDKVYVNLSYKFDPRAVKPPEFPAGMSVFATPSARERLLESAGCTAATGTFLASLGRSIQLQNCICPIKGPLLPEAEGNTKEYQWKEWKRQTEKKWTDSIDVDNNKPRGKFGLEIVQVAEPSETWQKELGVSLVPMGEVYDAENEGKRRRQGLGVSETESVSLVEDIEDILSRILARPTIEDANTASSWALITPPTVREDDASNHT
jgi:hypothetical protein